MISTIRFRLRSCAISREAVTRYARLALVDARFLQDRQEGAAALFDPEATLYFSTASAWEIAIKYSIGKLPLPAPPASYIAARAAGGDFRIIDVRLEHALAVADLPRHHDDPFDRLLVAQCITEGFRLVTADRRLAMYDVDLVTV
jgi:PIN domain nuclease of toxin-antitoxin system